MGKRLNSPNDLVFKSNGDLYFTDPPYGLPKSWDDPRRELDFQGVYRLSQDGKLTLLTKEMTRPNGIGLSPDEKTLYVAQLRPEARDLDGVPGEGRRHARRRARLRRRDRRCVGKQPGLPDGLKVDQKGNLFATGPGGVHVFAPDGKHLGRIVTGDTTANCGWGDDGIDALHHRRHGHLPGQDQDQGRGLVAGLASARCRGRSHPIGPSGSYHLRQFIHANARGGDFDR